MITLGRSLKPDFSRSLQAGTGKLHLAAHSHHLWPDVSRLAHLQAWDDAALFWDAKWQHVFDQLIPAAQAHIARHLHVPDPASITFAPNTHEFVARIFSCLPAGRVPRVLSSDSEFYSFNRQAQRLAQEGLIDLHLLPTAPYTDFESRFATTALQGSYDLIFVSQVFFNSALAIADLAKFVEKFASTDAIIVIDGYHGFMARPTDLSEIWQRVFYLAGGYKYAMAGEGACFLMCPPGIAPRPRNTGWYASYGTLSAPSDGGVAYASDGARFAGATFDPSGLYRLNAVMTWLQTLQIDAGAVHQHVCSLQKAFVAEIDFDGLRSENLLVPLNDFAHGNFLAYRGTKAKAIHDALMAAGIMTDVRGDVLRIGFGVYHDQADIPDIITRIRAALSPAPR